MYILNILCSFDSALVCAFEKAKKKYLDKMKKMEVHMQCISERYEAQVGFSALAQPSFTHLSRMPFKR